MIVAKIFGGLGNQMFQYALGRALAYKNKTALKLDVLFFADPGPAIYRKYGLHAFNITEDFATEQDLAPFRKGKLRRFLEKIKPYYQRSIVMEPHFHFAPEILRITDNAYLEGYWQTEKYFKEIEPIIKQEFSLKKEHDHRSPALVTLIQNTLAVSIHVRRGDYVTDLQTSSFHGTCSLDYYHRAIKVISDTIKNPHFFIFSDDPEWTRNNLKTHLPITFVSNGTLTEHEEMMLLSQCEHHIIANSSFSWWGAWLSLNPQKLVIAPQKWLNDQTINTCDLIPESWIKI